MGQGNISKNNPAFAFRDHVGSLYNLFFAQKIRFWKIFESKSIFRNKFCAHRAKYFRNYNPSANSVRRMSSSWLTYGLCPGETPYFSSYLVFRLFSLSNVSKHAKLYEVACFTPFLMCLVSGNFVFIPRAEILLSNLSLAKYDKQISNENQFITSAKSSFQLHFSRQV